MRNATRDGVIGAALGLFLLAGLIASNLDIRQMMSENRELAPLRRHRWSQLIVLQIAPSRRASARASQIAQVYHPLQTEDAITPHVLHGARDATANRQSQHYRLDDP